jgi:hypothetical protein
MMHLCILPAENCQSLFGTPEAQIQITDLDIVAQRPDCSAFLVLSLTLYPALTEVTTVPDGFDFTYCQEWGLTINNDVVHRVIQALRASHYPPVADYLDAQVKGDTVAQAAYVTACLGVKARYPKITLG